MCCFSQPVTRVADTRIFARLNRARGSQFLVYQMKYEATRPVAMILPLPVALPARERTTVRFVNLQEYADFFKDLESGFPPVLTGMLGVDETGEVPNSSRESKPLVVEAVGDFVASFVPTVNDFGRLDRRFVIPKSTWNRIPLYRDYGFAVFQLKGKPNEETKPHPMAFEFQTRHTRSLFFPTVHIHDGKIHEQEEFDHVLYAQGLRHRDVPTYTKSDSAAGRFVDSRRAKGVVDPNLFCFKHSLGGTLPNRDKMVRVA